MNAGAVECRWARRAGNWPDAEARREAGSLSIECRRSLRIAALLLLAPQPAHANGASWGWEKPTGVPGPVRAEGLALEREEVVFEARGVRAVFDVRNLTDHAITTPMGFPLSQVADKGFDEDALVSAEAYARDRLQGFRVTVNDRRVPWRLAVGEKGRYPKVIRWTMTYAPGALTRFTVQYPLRYSHETAFGDEILLRYITHTGAYWSRPIGEALFRFCDQRVMAYYLDGPEGREWDPKGWSYTDYRFTVHPSDAVFEPQSRCLVWRRSQWTPKPDVDDLALRVAEVPPTIDLPDEERLLDHWCGLHEVTSDETLGDFNLARPDSSYQAATTQLAAAWEGQPLDEERFARIEAAAWLRLRHNAKTLTLAEAPPHYRLLVRRALLEYLRNHPYGLRSHEFRREELSSCFAAVKNTRQGPLTAREEADQRLIRRLEAVTGEALRVELSKLRVPPRGRRAPLREVYQRQ